MVVSRKIIKRHVSTFVSVISLKTLPNADPLSTHADLRSSHSCSKAFDGCVWALICVGHSVGAESGVNCLLMYSRRLVFAFSDSGNQDFNRFRAKTDADWDGGVIGICGPQ